MRSAFTSILPYKYSFNFHELRQKTTATKSVQEDFPKIRARISLLPAEEIPFNAGCMVSLSIMHIDTHICLLKIIWTHVYIYIYISKYVVFFTPFNCWIIYIYIYIFICYLHIWPMCSLYWFSRCSYLNCGYENTPMNIVARLFRSRRTRSGRRFQPLVAPPSGLGCAKWSCTQVLSLPSSWLRKSHIRFYWWGLGLELLTRE